MFIENRQKISRGFDTQLIISYLLLVLIGWFSIFSSSYDPIQFDGIFNLSTPYGRQLIWIATSLLIAIVILFVNANIYQHYAYIIFIIFLLLMILVAIIGTEVSGAKAWIKVGNFSIQPSEFMKMTTAMALAKFLNEGKTSSEKHNRWFICALIIFLPIIIITFFQQDTGSALVFVSFIFLFYREGMSGKILILGTSIVALVIFTLKFNELYAIATLVFIYIISWFFNKKTKLIRNTLVFVGCICFVFVIEIAYEKFLQVHQKQRIDSILGKTSDPKGVDFNLNQSKIAIGSGGFAGKGFLKGTQTKFNFVPEQSTDFIFCGIGEEWGFLGSLVLIGTFLFLIIRIILLSERHRNPFVRYYGYGIAGILFFHVFVNIGMTIGLVPIIGIPLPFISYGGSSIWAFTTMLFIFIKLNET